ncbi:MAG: FemAB family XrtA/PEP-CTERM system-associated protein [Gemmatimonadales bacterium]
MTLDVSPFRGAPAEWDAFAVRQPGFTHFHRHGWKDVMEQVFRHECVYLEARSGGALAGVLPLVRVRSRIFGHYLVSMPFLNYGGPLGTDDGVRALAAHAVERARADGVKLLELRSRRELPLELPASHRKVTVVLDLPTGGADALLKAFGSKLRSQVRRPAKEGVEVRFGSDQVAPFFEVFSRHMRDLGTPTQSRRLFEAVARRFPDDSWFGVAWLRGRPIAGGAGLHWGGEFEMTWASALAEQNRIAANMGLYWAFLERAMEQGYRTFNFGRCTPGSGTHRFKLQWGGRDEALHWYQWTPEGGLASTPSPDEGAYSWGPRLWKKLPVGLATALGPRVVRGIP